MKTKDLKKYLKTRLTKKEIADIENQARMEFEALKNLQEDINSALDEYMHKESIGFNETVRRMQISPTQFNKIRKGTANITLATLARMAAFFGKKPKLVFV